MPETPYNRWRPHPWHGLKAGPHPPERMYAYIEITPFDPVKYEIDKENYGRDEALMVVEAGLKDYELEYSKFRDL